MYGRYTDEWKVSNIRRNKDSLVGTLLRREWNKLFSTSKFQVFIVEANQSTYIHDRLTLDHVFYQMNTNTTKGLTFAIDSFSIAFFGQKHNEKQIINTAWSAWMEKEKEHRIQWNSPTSFAYERDRFHWSSKWKRRCLRQPSNTRHYLRAESAATAVDYTPEGLVASVRQHVSFQPPSRTGTPPLHLAALPLADEIITSGLRVDVRYLKRSSLSMNNISEPRTVARHGVARCCNEIISSGYSVAM